MRAVVFAIPWLAMASLSVQAQQPARPPEIIIGGAPQADDIRPAGGGARGSSETTEKFERCVDVMIGSERSFGCMNEKLRRQVDRVNPPITNTPPIDAKSSDLKTGVVNVPAVQQQYGRSFGVSAFPYRPPPPVYVAPIGPTAHH